VGLLALSLLICTFGCCILLRIYPTGSLLCCQSQQSFNTSTPPFLFFLLTHYTFRPLRAILRWDIQLDVSKDYSCYNGSAVRTQLDVCLYRYFDPWSPIHVIRLSIKVVKTLKFTVTGLSPYWLCWGTVRVVIHSTRLGVSSVQDWQPYCVSVSAPHYFTLTTTGTQVSVPRSEHGAGYIPCPT
jgi:hypothetical protein